jgi:DNA-binding NarL/FixJ family response regulator
LCEAPAGPSRQIGPVPFSSLRGNGPHAWESAAAGIFDAGDGDAEYETLRRLAADLRPAPVIALLGFPRVEDRDRAVAAGAAAVLSKPLLLEDLYWQLDRLLLPGG